MATPSTPETKAAEAGKTCSACNTEIHFFRAVIGGKQYGYCRCEKTRTWIMDAKGVRFENHNGEHDAGCSCDYCGKPSRYSPAARELAAYEADIYKAKRNARVAKKASKQRGATKAQLAHRTKLFGSASPSIHDDAAAVTGTPKVSP